MTSDRKVLITQCCFLCGCFFQELHAHLTGSLSDDTVLHLVEAKEKELGISEFLRSAKVSICKGQQRSLEELSRLDNNNFFISAHDLMILDGRVYMLIFYGATVLQRRSNNGSFCLLIPYILLVSDASKCLAFCTP